MSPVASGSFGTRKLYFLRVQRFCQVLRASTSDGITQPVLGLNTGSALAPENFRYISSIRMRILCAMWHLLSKHRFREAAKLLAHTIHEYPFPASWIWRVAFQLFRCMDATKQFIEFNRVLDQSRLSDQNNRILEQILHHMARGDFLTACKCLSNKTASIDRYTSSESIITREPEFEHVQRLQHLYEGLCYYGLWLQRLHSSRDHANTVVSWVHSSWFGTCDLAPFFTERFPKYQ
ncbi:unnamed protein product [Dicrocoelium dendriticum]|nr:unnamed protein product [Dicrocoelium dendriticum]